MVYEFIFWTLFPKLHFKHLGWFIERCLQGEVLVAKKMEVRRDGSFSIEDALGMSRDGNLMLLKLFFP